MIPTLIFDEIDNGISGVTASIVAKKLREISQKHQIICITHLPQIAAMGATHYKVYKEDKADTTVSTMTKLNTDDRVREIAQMLSGSDISEAAISNAKALLKIKN